MVISALKHNDTIYIDAHAEQSYTGSFLADKGDINTNINLGIFGQELTRETLKNICDYAETQPKNSVMVLDFTGLKDVQSNQQDSMKTLKSHFRRFILTNVSEEIVKKLNIAVHWKNIPYNGSYDIFYVADDVSAEELADCDLLFNALFVKQMKGSVIESSGSASYRHNSPIYIPKFIDVKAMMSSNQPFFLYIIYKLALKIKEKAEWFECCPPPILFCQNLNGAFIASVLSSFLGWDILTMDHIGPVNKIYSNIGSKIKTDAKYIVISDVVCIGTEIRICRNIINYSGGIYIGNVNIVQINTLAPEHLGDENLSAFNITRDNNPIDYKILTALDF